MASNGNIFVQSLMKIHYLMNSIGRQGHRYDDSMCAVSLNVRNVG
jgi:hypothetical protein